MSTPITTIPSTQESYTFTLTGTNITQTEQAKINEKICRMIEDSLNSKLEGFKTNLGEISDGVLAKTRDTLMEKMELAFMKSFEDKLDEFKKQIVDNQKSDELMQQIIYELGIKFDAALEGNRDSSNIDSYTRFAETHEQSLKSDKETADLEDEELAYLERRMLTLMPSDERKSEIKKKLSDS